MHKVNWLFFKNNYGHWSNFPNGISLTTATGAVDGQLNATSMKGLSGQVYGARIPMGLGSAVVDLYVVPITSALYDGGATLRAPCRCVAEVIHVQGATADIARTVRVTGGSVSTAAAVLTMTILSIDNPATTITSSIGSVILGQGSFLHLTSAVTATTNSAELMLNLIPIE